MTPHRLQEEGRFPADGIVSGEESLAGGASSRAVVTPERSATEGSAPPAIFSFSRWLIRKKIRGGWRLWQALFDAGALDFVADYVLEGPEGATLVRTPLNRRESSWSASEVEAYEAATIAAGVAAATRIGGPLFLIDCGADIGIVSAAFIRNCPGLRGVRAFEPNPQSFLYLQSSAAVWPVPTEVVNAGVGARRMTGSLAISPDDPSAHANFMVEDPNGAIQIVRVDDFPVDPDCAVLLKVDVEGGEGAVIEGAMETLARARAFAVIFEAHPQVLARTGADPCVIIRQLQSISPVTARVVQAPDLTLDPSRPFIDQVSGYGSRNFDVICASEPRLN